MVLNVGFSKSNKKLAIFSWLIKLTENTPYSHVYIKWYSESLNRNIIYQASHTMVNYMGSVVFNSQEDVIKEFQFNIDDAKVIELKQFCIDNAGKPYGVLAVLGLAYVQILKWIGIKASNPLKNEGETYVCSQLVATILKNCLSFNISEDLNDITPHDLYQIVENLPQNLK